MQAQNNFIQITGVIQHYAWGGKSFIANWLGKENEPTQPMAEYWLGTHANGMAYETNSKKPLLEYTKTALPYLAKILDVNEILSLQVHPSIPQAIDGYKKENEKGIALDAFNRNYKDQNHKPECMIALSDFWLLHGFLLPDLMIKVLQKYPSFEPLLNIYNQEGLAQLLKHIYFAEPIQIQQWLQSVLAAPASNNKLEPLYWFQQIKNLYYNENNADPGLVILFLMNVVYLKKGEAIYQKAGLMHAYMKGQNVEVMANSDNVLRGSLTTKYTNYKELLAVVNTAPTIPAIISPKLNVKNGLLEYDLPLEDFQISSIELAQNSSITIEVAAKSMMIIYNGKEVSIQNNSFKQSDVLFFTEATKIEINAHFEASLFYIYSKITS
jgi:mannose-6-phosphate isomerase